MECGEIESGVRRYVAERDLMLWEDFPWGGATALWPGGDDLGAFLEVLERFDAPILYMEGEGDIVGFAVNGVIHAFPSSETRRRLTDNPWTGEIEPESDSNDESSSQEPAHYNPYYNYRSGIALEGDLRELVDRIVADKRYNGYGSSRHLVADYVAHLEAQDAHAVETAAERVFSSTVGEGLDARARRHVSNLVADPEFDPLAWGRAFDGFLIARLPDEDPRVLERLGRELPTYAREAGLASKAEREVAQAANRLLDDLPALVRDQLGFTTKNPARLQLIRSYVADMPEHRQDRVVRQLVALESDIHSATREARYATAVRSMLARGITKAEISRRLGISTSVMDRIVSANRSDVELAVDDPILTTLAPEIV